MLDPNFIPPYRWPQDENDGYLRHLQDNNLAFRVCYHKPPHLRNWCGTIYWTEQDLIDTYNEVSFVEVTSAEYITFCPLCRNYFPGERWAYKVRKFYG